MEFIENYPVSELIPAEYNPLVPSAFKYIFYYVSLCVLNALAALIFYYFVVINVT
jgi:hypothetical protein